MLVHQVAAAAMLRWQVPRSARPAFARAARGSPLLWTDEHDQRRVVTSVVRGTNLVIVNA